MVHREKIRWICNSDRMRSRQREREGGRREINWPECHGRIKNTKQQEEASE
jgi:hypothetical protein